MINFSFDYSFDLDSAYKDMDFRIKALESTFRDVDDTNFDIVFSSPKYASHLMVFGKDKNDAKERFIEFANSSNFIYGNIISIKQERG